MKIKINLRLVGIAILAILTTVIGITIIYYGDYKKRVRMDLETSARILQDSGLFDNADLGVIGASGINIKTNVDDLRVTWIAEDGTVLYDNGAKAAELENHMNRPEVQAALSKGHGEKVRHSDTMGKNTFYEAYLLENGSVLRVATDAVSIWSVFMTAAPLLGVIVLVVVAICVILSHLLTKQLLRPIELMADNLDNSEYEAPYKELTPFSEKLRSQHAEILLAAKSRQDFTANVSHELKTPLTAISGYAELLESGMVGEEQREHFYHEIRKSSNRLFSLINDIIRLSELDGAKNTPPFADLNLYDVVADCESELVMAAKARNVSLSFSGTIATVYGNTNMLKELVENLASNAIRYNNSGGHVWISVTKSDSNV
nr:two-component sensor histidine kinase [Lachnospiraceae bacterium]